MPFDAWLRGPLNAVLEDTLSSRCVKERGLLKPDAVQTRKNRYYEKKTGWGQPMVADDA